MYVSCEYLGAMIELDLTQLKVIATLNLRPKPASPQDVKLSPDGTLLYTADQDRGGLWVIDPKKFKTLGFIHTGAGAHGLYPSRDAKRLYVSNRTAGTISVINFATSRVVKTWRLGPSSPDMGGVSDDGKTLWLSGRYNAEVYAIDTQTGRLRARIAVGKGPHGMCVWPQPGRYSLGHTGILR
jgi:YVTN family beta-propeller protein